MKVATLNKENERLSPYSLQRSIQRMMTKEGFTPYRIAVEAGVNRTELTAWLEDREQPELPGFFERLEAWLAGDGENVPVMPMDSPAWVETVTAREVMDALDYARYTPTIAVIYGSAGVGKTRAMEYFAQTRKRTWLVTASPCCHTPVALLGEVVRVLGSWGSAQRADVLFREAMKLMRAPQYERCGVNGLLIIDEAQHLRPPAYDTIRAFHDQAGMGIVYSGNEEVYSRIGGKKQSRLAQISSRVGMRVKLTQPKPEDVDMILEAHGISGRKEREYCQWVAVQDGGLRLLDHIIRPAKLAALSAGTAVTAAMLKSAGKSLGIEA